MSQLPDLRDVLTDDGHELPPVRLTPTQRAVVDAAMRRAYHLTCTCGHDIDDHQPVTDGWLIGFLESKLPADPAETPGQEAML